MAAKKILIIEDEKNVRANLVEILRLKNFQVDEASNGKQGIIKALQNPPDLIICDVMMPEMDGFEVVKLIRKNKEVRNVPFIFLTAKTEKKDNRKGMDLGADDYIYKPFKVQELFNAITSRLQRQSIVDQEIQEKVNAFIHQLNSTSSHELNTPLNGILGGAEFLANYMDRLSNDKIKRLINGIYQSGQRLQTTIENTILFNDLQNIENDSKRLELITQGSCPNSAQIVEDIAVDIAQRFDRIDDIRLAVEPASLKISPENFRKIVHEAVDNAFKFSEVGTIVSLKTEQDNAFYHLNIEDQGRGMTQEQINQIGPFMQFERQQYAQQGSGLGLYLIKRLITLNNGQFHISSEYQKNCHLKLSFKYL